MNSTYNCVIVDDEQDAIDLLSTRISHLYDNLHIADTFTNWETALPALRNNTYDILFIDVSMPGKTGLDLLKLLPGLEAEIIFVTAYDNFALKAFSFSATGYILKPVDDAELSVAIDKAIERIRNKTLANLQRTQPSKLNDRIGVPNNHGVDYVNVNDIIYLESVNKCTVIVTDKGKFTSSSNIGLFKYLVDNHSFFQAHRLFIINLNCILRYETSGVIIMQDKKEIPVSRNVKHDLLKMFNNL